MRLTEFLKYLERKEQKLPDELWEHLSTTKELFYSGSMLQSAVTELQNLVEKHVQPLMAEFRAEFSKKSPTFQIWDSLIDAIHNLLLNLRAEREGDWPLHLHSFLSFLPYYAITDKPNYTRYSPVYLMDMLALPDNVEEPLIEESLVCVRPVVALLVLHQIWVLNTKSKSSKDMVE